MTTGESIHSIHGKWSQPGVPHKGWRWVDEYDSCEDGEELHLTCEMCESQSIRYVHVMQHDHYDGLLKCGCICSGRMQEDLVSAKARDKAMQQRGRARVRAKKALKKRWANTGTKTWKLQVPEGKFTVFENGRGYNIRLHPRGEDFWFDNTNYPNPDDAKVVVEAFVMACVRR